MSRPEDIVDLLRLKAGTRQFLVTEDTAVKAADEIERLRSAILAAEQRGAEMEREQCAALCSGHIEVVGSKGRWLERHEILNEEVHAGLTYAAAIRNRTGE